MEKLYWKIEDFLEKYSTFISLMLLGLAVIGAAWIAGGGQ